MNRAGDQLFARARFARDQDGSIGFATRAIIMRTCQNRRAAPENLRRTLQAVHGEFQEIVFPEQFSMLASAPDGSPDDVRLKRLGDEIESALAHAFDGQFDGGKSREKDNG